MSKHEIIIESREDGLELVKGLPKNWKVIVRDYREVEAGDRLARLDQDDGKYFVQYELEAYCGEYVAPKLLLGEFQKCYMLVQNQVKRWGYERYRSTLKALEKCIGY